MPNEPDAAPQPPPAPHLQRRAPNPAPFEFEADRTLEKARRIEELLDQVHGEGDGETSNTGPQDAPDDEGAREPDDAGESEGDDAA